MLENIQALASNPVGMMLLLIVGGHIAVFVMRLVRR